MELGAVFCSSISMIGNELFLVCVVFVIFQKYNLEDLDSRVQFTMAVWCCNRIYVLSHEKE